MTASIDAVRRFEANAATEVLTDYGLPSADAGGGWAGRATRSGLSCG
jgi:hypothetical protein